MSNYESLKENIISFENYFESPKQQRRLSLICLTFSNHSVYHSWFRLFDSIILSNNHLTFKTLFCSKSIPYTDVISHVVYFDKITLQTYKKEYTIYCNHQISNMISHRLQKY